MGLRVKLNDANWLAALLEPELPLPPFYSLGETETLQTERLSDILRSLSTGFYSTGDQKTYLHNMVESALRTLDIRGLYALESSLSDIRAYLGNRPWTALIVPSGQDQYLDERLSSPNFLTSLLSKPDHGGLFLQATEAHGGQFVANVFPAFQKALDQAPYWPGLLVWNRTGGSCFFAANTRKFTCAQERITWIAHWLQQVPDVDLDSLLYAFLQKFPDARHEESDVINILHLSDVHLGKPSVQERLPRMKGIIKKLVDRMYGNTNMVPVVSGDLVDDPCESNMPHADDFMEFLWSLDIGNPLFVPGNHDFRKGGHGTYDWRLLQTVQPFDVHPIHSHNVCLVGFDSSSNGDWARGLVTTQSLGRIGNRLDNARIADYHKIGFVHHHPLDIPTSEWVKRHPLEVRFEKVHANSVAFENAPIFLEFVKQRDFKAIMHGHKHIPRFAQTDCGIPVFGCGSTGGELSTKSGRTIVSMNVLTVNRHTGETTCRFLTEDVPGAGISERSEYVVTG